VTRRPATLKAPVSTVESLTGDTSRRLVPERLRGCRPDDNWGNKIKLIKYTAIQQIFNSVNRNRATNYYYAR